MANEPITREEIMLNAIATGETANLKPITREEMFLAKLGGADVNTPTPITRKEQFLQKAIEGGGGGSGGGETGGGDSAMLDAFIEGTLTEISSNAESVGKNAFYNHQTLTTVNFPMATNIEESSFYGCFALTTVNFPVLNSIGKTAFFSCDALTTVNFPMATSVNQSAFQACKKLTVVNFPMATSIGQNVFFNCLALTALILRATGKICTLSNREALNNTPIASGTGYIYVPSTLIERYKTATNWSNYAAQFRALEDYTVDGTTTGELDPSKI